jgi:hypothetical protein
MIKHETPELRSRRHKIENIQKGIASVAIAGAIIYGIVEYIPNNLKGTPKPPGVSVVSDQSTNNQPAENLNIKFQP